MTKTMKLAEIATASLIALTVTSTSVKAGQEDIFGRFAAGLQRTQVAGGMNGILAAPQPPSIACVGAQPTRCVIKASNGISRVRFVNEGPSGRTDIFSRSYGGCPTEVTVTWNTDMPVNNSRIVQCMPKPVFQLY